MDKSSVPADGVSGEDITASIDRTAETSKPIQPGLIVDDTLVEMPKTRSRSRQIVLMTALLSTLFITCINTTLLNNALPTITTELKSAGSYAWIGGAFMLASAASSPIWAKLSDIWGRKPIVLCAIAAFFASSVICATAVNITALIAGRALQGTAAGGITQVVSIIISDLFSIRHRSLYLGLLEVVWAVAGGVGPVVGGTLVQNASWRWIFWIILPPCAVAFILLVIALDVHNPRTKLKEGLMAVDWFGSVTMLGFLIMVLLALNFGGAEFAWDSTTVICLLVFGGVMSLFFIFCEKKLAQYPLVPLAIFTKTSNLAVLFIAFAHDFALISVEYYIPFYFQSGKGMSPTKSGVLLLPFTFVTCISGFSAGLYINRTGRYLELLWIGQGLLVIGMALFTQFSESTTIAFICGIQVLAASGMGMLFAPPLIALQASVPQSQTATATATMTLIRNISAVLAVVSGQAIFQNGMLARQGQLAALQLPTKFRTAFTGAEAAASVGLIKEIPDQVQQIVVRQIFSYSLGHVWILDACLVGLGFLATVFVVKTKLSKEHVETKTGLSSQET